MEADGGENIGANQRLYSALLDFLESAECGALCDTAGLLARYPEVAPQLQEFIDTWIRLDTLTEPVRSLSKSFSQAAGEVSIAAPLATLPGTAEPAASVKPRQGADPENKTSGQPAGARRRGGEWLSRWLAGLPLPVERDPARANPGGQEEIGWLGPYRLLEVVGRGGMGIVFRAEDVHLQRPAAVKVLRPELAADKSARQRFLREARLAAALTHEHVAAVYQVGEDAGVAYLAMQWLTGLSLEDALQRVGGSLDVPTALRLGRQTALGLAAAHDRGFLHRDIKPANLWVEPPAPDAFKDGLKKTLKAGRVKILDFGLARAAADEGQLTRSGMLVGTPAYMAPEQSAGESMDARTDLFSLGVVLYRMCTGCLPYPVRAAGAALPETKPRSLRDFNQEVPPEFDDLVMSLLSADPVERPASAVLVAERLKRLEDQQSAARVAAPLPRSAPAPRPSAGGPGKRLWLVGLVALALLLPFGYEYGGVLVRFATNQGQVVIVVDDPDTQVTVSEGGAVIEDRKGQRTITLTAGEHDLHVTVREPGGESRFFTKKLVLRRGGREIITVSQELPPVGKPAPASREAEGQPSGTPVLPTATNSERSTAEWALGLGGKVRIRGTAGEQVIEDAKSLPADDFQVVSLDLQKTGVTDSGLAHLRGLKQLRSLALGGTAISDAGLSDIQGLQSLEELNLNDTHVDSAGLALLRPLTRLRYLSLHKVPVDDAGAGHIAVLRNLETLDLEDCNVTDAALACFKVLTNLQRLYIPHSTRVTNAGLEQLPELKTLRELNLNRTSIDSAGLAHLVGLQNLRYLNFVNTRVGDAGLEHVGSILSLQQLSIGGTEITDAGLAYLSRLKDLRHIDVTQTRIGDAGLTHLAGFKELRSLILERTQVSDPRPQDLSGFSKLRTLELGDTRVSDAIMPAVGVMKDLGLLSLANTRVTDAGLAHLQTLKKLESLYLINTRVSDASLEHFLHPGLKVLDMRGTRISATGAAAVKGLLPNAQFQWWEPNRRAAEMVLALGGTVHERLGPREDDTPVKSASELPADYFRLTRAALAGVRKPLSDALTRLAALNDPVFDDLEEVDLRDSGVTDADLECLKTLACRRLVLDGAPVNGPGLAHLQNLPRLTDLSLQCPTLSFLGVRYLGEFKQLKRLSLARSGANDSSLKYLRALKELRELDLSGTKVTAEGIAALQKDLPQCRIVSGTGNER